MCARTASAIVGFNGFGAARTTAAWGKARLRIITSIGTNEIIREPVAAAPATTSAATSSRIVEYVLPNSVGTGDVYGSSAASTRRGEASE
jgi:hypothetical protein